MCVLLPPHSVPPCIPQPHLPPRPGNIYNSWSTAFSTSKPSSATIWAHYFDVCCVSPKASCLLCCGQYCIKILTPRKSKIKKGEGYPVYRLYSKPTYMDNCWDHFPSARKIRKKKSLQRSKSIRLLSETEKVEEGATVLSSSLATLLPLLLLLLLHGYVAAEGQQCV